MAQPSRIPRPRRIVVAGLGNVLLTDDGVGVHAVRALRGRLPRGILAVEVGTAVLDALHLFEWADAILAIDALAAQGAPGTIYACDEDAVAQGGVPASLHELDLQAGLRFLPGPRRPSLAVLGVEPEQIDIGLALSPRLQAVLPRLVEEAVAIVSRWRASPSWWQTIWSPARPVRRNILQ